MDIHHTHTHDDDCVNWQLVQCVQIAKKKKSSNQNWQQVIIGVFASQHYAQKKM